MGVWLWLPPSYKHSVALPGESVALPGEKVHLLSFPRIAKELYSSLAATRKRTCKLSEMLEE